MREKFPLRTLAIVGAATISGAALAHGAEQDKPAASAPATAATEFTAGASVRDSKGVQLATVVSADANQVVLNTGQTKIGVPLKLFTKTSQGLALTITADQFNQAVSKAHARMEAAKAQPQDATTQPAQQQQH